MKSPDVWSGLERAQRERGLHGGNIPPVGSSFCI